MATKKNNPNVQKRVAERKAFVASKPELSKEVARKRFYVQTRAKELEAAGKTVDRAALRKKFETTTIQRAGFQTAQDIQKAAARRAAATSASSAPIPSPSVTGRTPSDSTRTRAATTSSSMMGQRRKAVPGFKAGNVQPSSMKKQGNADRLLGDIRRGIGASLESIRATFIAPAWNDTIGRISPSRQIREADTKEKLVTGISFFLSGGAGRAALSGTTATGRLALGPGARGAIGAGKPPLALGPGPRALPPGPRPVSAARTAAGRARADAAFKSLREAQAAPKAVTKAPVAKTTKAPVAKTQKPVAKTTKAPAAKAQKPVAKKAPAAKTQKPVAKKATAKKAAPQPVKAATKKAAAPKASAPVKAPATQSPKMVTSTGRSSTSAGRAKAPVKAQAPSTARRFSSQAEWNKFMDKGGKEILRNMPDAQREATLQLNKGWIIGRSRAAQAQARTRAEQAALRARAIDSRNKNMLSRMRKKGLTFTE